MSYARIVLAHLCKDLRLEWRSKDAINGMLFFSLLVVVLFSFAFDPTTAVSRQIAGGILWVALLFATVTALNQTWTRELRNSVLDAQRMAPAAPSALFLAKVLANFFFVTAAIDPYGRVVQSLPRHTQSSLYAHFGFENDLTFYSVHGDLFAWLCAIMAIVLAVDGCIQHPQI